MLGAGSAYGLYSRFGAATPRGSGAFTVYRNEHWMFEGTGLRYGDLLGVDDGVVGYETVGCRLAFDAYQLPIAAGGDGTPEQVEVVAFTPSSNLAMGEYPASIAALDDQGDLEFIASRLHGRVDADTLALCRHGNAVMLTCRPFGDDGGEVVTIGSTDWVFGLAGDPLVGQVTQQRHQSRPAALMRLRRCVLVALVAVPLQAAARQPRDEARDSLVKQLEDGGLDSADGGMCRRGVLRGQEQRGVEGVLRSPGADAGGSCRVRRVGPALRNRDRRVALAPVSRVLTVAAAQLGPVQRDHSREQVVERMIAPAPPGRAARCRAGGVPGARTDDVLPPLVRRRHHRGRPLVRAIDAERRHATVVRRGHAGSASASASATRCSTTPGRRWNVQTLVERDGSIVASYTKTHIPGHEHNEPDRPFQHAERYYFEPSPDGFGVWRAFGGLIGMMICNDRRWPETLSGDGPAGRRDDPVRLQHPDPLRARPEPGHPAGFPQRARDAERRVPERHVGGRRRQGWRRGRRRLVGAVDDHRAERPDRRPGR